jgi:nucleoside triphosphate pyrophosphatase
MTSASHPSSPSSTRSSALPPFGNPHLVLASQSPRRAHLLQQLGLHFEIVPAHVDETYRRGETPRAHAERLAREKARVVAGQRPDALVIGSDTVVVLDRNVLGKPTSRQDAIAMLMKLQGRTHRVETGIAVATSAELLSGVETVRVHFRPMNREMAERYVDTNEPMDKAGAYGIQGYGSALVERIEGDYFAVMGLPIGRLLGLLREVGWQYNFRGLERVS